MFVVPEPISTKLKPTFNNHCGTKLYCKKLTVKFALSVIIHKTEKNCYIICRSAYLWNKDCTLKERDNENLGYQCVGFRIVAILK